MANVKLTFYGTNNTETDNIGLECYATNSNHICIILKDTEIYLDKSTAIKFSKVLRTEISKIQ